MRDYMASRGPDGSGEWHSDDGRVGFGHRRLSIIDLSSRGAQPMQTANGRMVISFNGEIYNYCALRSRLEAKGYAFRSNSDTEVLLHLYAELGHEMLRELRGMFAFGIWDCHEQQLLLARDPYGIKPLYYADDGSTLRFASQVKALIAGGGISKIRTPPDGLGSTCLAACRSPSLHTGTCAPFPLDHIYTSISTDCGSRSSIIRLREPIARRKNDGPRLEEKKSSNFWSGTRSWTACVTTSSLMCRSVPSCLQGWIPAPSSV